MTPIFKRLLSGILSATMTLSTVPIVSAYATESTESYPYTMFAASSEEGAITVDAGNFCVNGNVATNGTIVSSGNMNINGTKTESAEEAMIFIFDKIDNKYFSTSNVDEHNEDYTVEDVNININVPTEVQGEAILTGNININSALKALEDVNLYGEVKNTNDSVIFSKYGDIVIDSQNVNLNGLVYAPFGSVTVTAQNLNLNNVVIIAESIVLTCPNVNANYSSSVSSFVGTTSEPLDFPIDEWHYMSDENENRMPDFFEQPENYSKLLDSDEDMLPNCFEEHFGTNKDIWDTDNDGLSDWTEVVCGKSSPLLSDSDENGVFDGDEDFDDDSLTNLFEISIGTGIMNVDTDNDSLSDGDEVNIHSTDPTLYDTDGDTLSDAEEIKRGTSPLLADTDRDGVSDDKEKISQSFSYMLENENAKVKSVTVEMDTNGFLDQSTYIRSIMNEDSICSEVVGLIGEPFSIVTKCEFDTAKLTFEMSDEAVSEIPLENMLVLWYNEAEDEFVEMDTTYDTETSTISIETNHFSKYMVVDRFAWFDAWSVKFNYNPNRPHVGENYSGYNKNHTVLAIDCSGSMYDNDRVKTKTDINSAYDSQFPKTCGRITAGEKFVSQMMGNDRTSIVLFEEGVSYSMALTSNKNELKLGLQKVFDGGGTEFLPAIKASLEMFSDSELNDTKANKRIILLSDGGDFYKDKTKRYLTNLYDHHNPDIRNRVKIYTIALGSGADKVFLEEIANLTGGIAYTAYTADDLVDIYSQVGLDDFDTTDTDGDGLYDAVESAGIRLSNGKVIHTDPTKIDTDGDGVEDGIEVDPTIRKSTKKDIEGYVFSFKSYPDRKDSDCDLIPDDVDPSPLDSRTNFEMLYADGPDYKKLAQARIDEGPTPPDFFTEHWNISEQEFASEKRNLGEVVMDFLWEEASIYGSLYAYIPIANVTTTAWSFLAGNWKDGDKIAYGSAPNAAAMLDWYLFGFGAKCEISSDMFANLILSQEQNVEHYLKNLDACILEAECYVNENNKNGMLECRPDVRLNPDIGAEGGLYVSCFANRGQNCPYGHGQVSLASKYACDWNIAVGEAFGTLQADVHYMGNDMYQMGYTYYVYDVYEWPDIQGLRDLHLHGTAHQYQIVGWVSGSLMWKKGERCYNGALTESAILELSNNLSNVKEFFREMDINSDNMRDVLKFYGINS